MKKLRLSIHIATILLILIAITGIVIQILSAKSLADTAFDLISLSISVASVTLVIVTQLTAYQDRQKFMKMLKELDKIDAEVDTELKTEKDIDKTLHQKLDAVLADLNTLKTKAKK